MKLKVYWLVFISVLLIAGLIRFYKLGVIPHGMTWDEAAIGYNGSAIWKTRRDEWLVRLPTSFRSFGDYKAPLAIYLNGLFTGLLGMNLLVVRLPFAIAGVAAIAGFMLMVRELFGRYMPKTTAENLSLLGGWLMALSPWHIHYSRAGFESGLTLALLVWGLWFWLLSLRVKTRLWQVVFSVKAAVFLALTVYTYHSAKIVTPLLVLALGIFFIKKVLKRKVASSVAVLAGYGLLVPFIKDVVYGQGLQRLDSSILNDITGWPLLQAIGGNLLTHLNPAFLMMGSTTTLRHGGGGWGVLLPTTFALCVFAVVLYLWNFFTSQVALNRERKLFVISFLWIVIGLLPAAIGEEIPHSNRALLALPGFLVLALLGGKYLISVVDRSRYNHQVEGTHHEKDQVVKAVLGLLMLLHGFYAVGFLNHYFAEFARNSADDFKDGYLEAFEITKQYEDEVDKILFTSDYGQPYIYALFVRKTNPIWYQGGSLIKYEFTDKITTADLDRVNTLVVASNTDDTPGGSADKLIMGSDGQIRFKIYIPKKQ